MVWGKGGRSRARRRGEGDSDALAGIVGFCIVVYIVWVVISFLLHSIAIIAAFTLSLAVTAGGLILGFFTFLAADEINPWYPAAGAAASPAALWRRRIGRLGTKLRGYFRAIALSLMGAMGGIAGLFVLLENLEFFWHTFLVSIGAGGELAPQFNITWELPLILAGGWAVATLLISTGIGLDMPVLIFTRWVMLAGGILGVLYGLCNWLALHGVALPFAPYVGWLKIGAVTLMIVAYLACGLQCYSLRPRRMGLLLGSAALAGAISLLIVFLYPTLDVIHGFNAQIVLAVAKAAPAPAQHLLSTPLVSFLLYVTTGFWEDNQDLADVLE